jgi:TfoX/Sxy family transcriptional regulator of competence genes
MAYNEQLATRVRYFLAEYEPVEELRMMGGLCFMYKNKMLVGVVNDELMCRVDPELVPELIEQPGCTQMAMGGRSTKGYVLVHETALQRPQDFRSWLELTLAFNDRAKASRKAAKP